MVEGSQQKDLGHSVSDSLEIYPGTDFYKEWQIEEGVRVIEDFAFEDLKKVELSDWSRKGGKGAIINIPYHTLYNDAQIIEIAPAGQSESEKHLYEEQVYVLSGNGSSTIWQDEGEKLSFEWSEGSAFGIPLNSWYQHFNASGTVPARYIAVTNAPPMMRLIGDNEVIFNSSTRFSSRFNGERDYFSGVGQYYADRVWETNFIPNARDMALFGYNRRGAGSSTVLLEMTKGNTKSHISDFPVGTYKKAHRHGPGAHLLILSGQGFSLFWTKDDQSDLRKAYWSQNSMLIVPSDGCFHQHFNTGQTAARYLALRPGNMGLQAPGSMFWLQETSTKEGGQQIEYEDESQLVHQIFESELAKNDAPCLMKAFVAGCTGDVGTTDERFT